MVDHICFVLVAKMWHFDWTLQACSTKHTQDMFPLSGFTYPNNCSLAVSSHTKLFVDSVSVLNFCTSRTQIFKSQVLYYYYAFRFILFSFGCPGQLEYVDLFQIKKKKKKKSCSTSIHPLSEMVHSSACCLIKAPFLRIPVWSHWSAWGRQRPVLEIENVFNLGKQD